MTVYYIISCILSLLTLISLFVIIIENKNIIQNTLDIQVPDIDVYLKDLNNFIRKEFLFEFSKWILKSSITIEMNGPDRNPSFLNEIKNPNIVKNKISNITAIIISKMSKKLISSFYTVYKRNEVDKNDELYDYVARHVFFYIRKINFELTGLFTSITDIPALEIVKNYAIKIEEEIYEINNINILDINKDSSNADKE